MKWGQLTSATAGAGFIVAALAACGGGDGDGDGDGDGTPGVDAPLTASNFFVADGTRYDLVWAEAYLQGDPATLVVRAGGDPGGSCDPATPSGCYELVARLPPTASGPTACGADATLTLVIDGGAGPTFIAGAPFDGPCTITVERVDPIGGSVVLASLAGTLKQVGDVEMITSVTGGAISAPRGADR
jgi:hypothetical protein